MTRSDETRGNITPAGRQPDDLAAVTILAEALRHDHASALRGALRRRAGLQRKIALTLTLGAAGAAFRRIDAMEPEFAAVECSTVAVDPVYMADSIAGSVGAKGSGLALFDERDGSQARQRQHEKADQPCSRSAPPARPTAQRRRSHAPDPAKLNDVAILPQPCLPGGSMCLGTLYELLMEPPA